jgi:16S rRNA (adenine1518-N6/adenine1519-N6)-dimethyltransferase
VSRSIFWPIPNVDSSLVYFAKRDEPMGPEDLRTKTFSVIDASFAQRRKTLRQSLAELAGSAAAAEDLLVRAGISPQLRGEQLVIEDFIRIAKQL